MRGRITALGLVLVIATMGNITAFGSSRDNAGFETSTEVVNGDIVTSTVTGSVKVSNLSVAVSTTAVPDIDPMKETMNGLSQIPGQSTNYTIANNLALSIYVLVLGVPIQKVSITDSTTTPALVNEKNNLNAKGAVTSMVKDGAVGVPVPPLNTESDWVMANSVSTSAKYELNVKKGKLEQKPLVDNADGTSNMMTMRVYCATRNGWGSGDNFTVKPLSCIIATAPATTPDTW